MLKLRCTSSVKSAASLKTSSPPSISGRKGVCPWHHLRHFHWTGALSLNNFFIPSFSISPHRNDKVLQVVMLLFSCAPKLPMNAHIQGEEAQAAVDKLQALEGDALYEKGAQVMEKLQGHVSSMLEAISSEADRMGHADEVYVELRRTLQASCISLLEDRSSGREARLSNVKPAEAAKSFTKVHQSSLADVISDSVERKKEVAEISGKIASVQDSMADVFRAFSARQFMPVSSFYALVRRSGLVKHGELALSSLEQCALKASKEPDSEEGEWEPRLTRAGFTEALVRVASEVYTGGKASQKVGALLDGWILIGKPGMSNERFHFRRLVTSEQVGRIIAEHIATLKRLHALGLENARSLLERLHEDLSVGAVWEQAVSEVTSDQAGNQELLLPEFAEVVCATACACDASPYRGIAEKIDSLFARLVERELESGANPPLHTRHSNLEAGQEGSEDEESQPGPQGERATSGSEHGSEPPSPAI